MAVTSEQARKRTFNGTGTTGPFECTYPVSDVSEISVKHYDADSDVTVFTSPANYTATLIDGGAGGISVTTTANVAVGERLLVEAATPKTQPYRYRNGGAFDQERHEFGYDRLTKIVQEMDQRIDRCIQIPAVDTVGVTVELDDEDLRGDKIVTTDSDGNIELTDKSLLDDAIEAATDALELASALQGTSTTSNSIGTGSKSFTTQENKSFAAGRHVLVTSDANPSTNRMAGIVTAYSGTSLTVTMESTAGSGTYTDWTIRVDGERGATGATGPQGAPGAGTGDMLAANNLSDVASASTAFGNIKQAATDSATGVVELTTNAEAQTGTDTTRAVTAAAMWSALEKLIPIGSEIGYYGSSEPDSGARWKFPNGQAISRTTYSALFSLIGTTYGAGDGSTTFNLPNRQGTTDVVPEALGGAAVVNRIQKNPTISTTNASPTATVSSASGLSVGMYVFSTNVPAGTTIAAISGTTLTLSANATATASGTAARFSIINDPQTVGSVGGADTCTLTTPMVPSHAHDGSTLATNTTGSHTHTTDYGTTGGAGSETIGSNSYGGSGGTFVSNSSGSHSHTISGNTGNAGGGQPHPNLPPSFVRPVLIRVL